MLAADADEDEELLDVEETLETVDAELLLLEDEPDDDDDEDDELEPEELEELEDEDVEAELDAI